MENRLASSTSPYLRQHATNPVDWHPWGPSALSLARTSDRPILLSVGYSACHWCHVMAHESFEDPATAALMNEHFVNIKVDREERPDIDGVYQKVVQLLGQGGGWPLTVFLAPDGRPFYGGTYFPKAPSHGRPSFVQVLGALAKLWASDRGKVDEQADAFMAGLAQISDLKLEAAAGGLADEIGSDASLANAAAELVTRVDPRWGGFGRVPKFPNPTALEVLVRATRRDGRDSEVGRALCLTLDNMHAGGIYDHLRGGFARYSVDSRWLVPHFEKMLYDNAQLLAVYAEASVLWPGRAAYRTVVRETTAYLKADMRTPDGTFYAATDADSEGEEGRYFVWTPTEVRAVLTDDAVASMFSRAYGVTDTGNFEHGSSILHLPQPLESAARELDIAPAALAAVLDEARTALLAARYRRVAPLRDEKVLTAWNALLISGLCRAAQAARTWNDREFAHELRGLAEAAALGLVERHVEGVFESGGEHGQVLRAAFEGATHTRGYLDDVACLGRACLDLHELTLDPKWSVRAQALGRHALAQYAKGTDGFFFAAAAGEALIERTEAQHDGPTPSGLGVAVELLARLSAAGIELPTARETIAGVLERFAGATAEPFAFASLLTGASYYAREAIHVTLSGPDSDATAVAALADLAHAHRLRTAGAVSVSFEPAPEVKAVVCRDRVCSTPLLGGSTLLAALAELTPISNPRSPG